MEDLHKTTKQNTTVKKLKILQISTWRTPCGIAGYTENLVNQLIKFEEFAIDVYRIDKQKFSFTNPIAENEINKIINESKNANIVHFQHEFGFFGANYNLSNENFIKLLRKLRSNKKIIFITFHTLPLPTPSWAHARGIRSLFSIFIAKLLRNNKWPKLAREISKHTAYRVIAHNERSASILCNSGIAWDKINIVPLGLTSPTESNTGKLNSAKIALGYKKDDILIGLFGFVADYKGVLQATESLKFLPQNFKLVFVGGRHPDNKTDNSIDNILKLSSKLNLLETNRAKNSRNRIEISGWLPKESLDLYKSACDIIIAPYKEVNLSSSAALAMALTSGRPVIASTIDAFRDINTEYECMLLIGENSPRELAWAIEKLISDDDLSKLLVKNAKEYAEKYSLSNISNIYRSLYLKYSGILL